MFEITTIASGSTGNCYIVDDGQTKLMIECGITAKAIRKACGGSLPNVHGCLISHEHKDHCKAIKDVLKAGIDCHMSEGTKKAIGTGHHRARVCEQRRRFEVGTMKVIPFVTQHDAAQPLGFLIDSGDSRLLFATDTYYLRYRFPGLTHIMVECNYSHAILEENVNSGAVPAMLRKRVMRSHFELGNVKKFLLANSMASVEEIHLIHISGQNGDAELFRGEVQGTTGKPVFYHKK